MSDLAPVLAAVAGGVFPALAWLWFWRREDRAHPEPKKLIALAFLAGMVTVGLVIPIQKYVAHFLFSTTAIFTAWSIIEEVMKYIAARITVLWRREDDEPIDPVIYMITVALGFAALENTLFLLSPLAGGSPVETIMTGNLRFVGATLLHVLSSAVVGMALAFSFYKPHRIHGWYVLGGVILAALLHSGFNFLILNAPEEHLLRTFAIVWGGVIAVLAGVEFVKRIKPRFRK
ncbi:PrsW family intramembrane metalloprotease [Candidatus Kaiserbacteria bacterium]|nr:PrsW family intramembrane metalloprotease [Candidatus Kaiserbacteria bacterium]